MSQLFHYTTMEGLLGILKEDCMRATHIDFLNDSSEGLLYVEALERKLLADAFAAFEEIAAAARPEVEATPHLKRLPPPLRSSHAIAEAHATALITAMIDGLNQHAPRFLLSFSEHKDEFVKSNGLLSQWRGYGSAGSVCLVFDRNKIDEAVNGEKANQNGRCAISKVNYFHEGSRFDEILLRDGWQEVSEALSSLVTFGAGSTEKFFSSIENTLVPLTDSAPFYKHAAFSEEDEVRVAFAAYSQEYLEYIRGVDSSDQQGPSKIKQTEFRTRGSLMVPYIELFKGHVRSSLDMIIVGPGTESLRNAIATQSLVRKFRLSTYVRQSKVPYIW